MGLLELVALGAAVGVDTLSVSLGLGTLGLPRRRLFQFGSVFTLTTAILFSLGTTLALGLHSLVWKLPLQLGLRLFSGISVDAVGDQLHDLLTLLAAAILFLLGLQMLAGKGTVTLGYPVAVRGVWGLLTLATIVGMDAVAAGLSLGMLNAAQMLQAILVVGAVNGAMSFLGLGLGNRLRKLVDSRLRPIGGAFLVGISLRLIASLM